MCLNLTEGKDFPFETLDSLEEMICHVGKWVEGGAHAAVVADPLGVKVFVMCVSTEVGRS